MTRKRHNDSRAYPCRRWQWTELTRGPAARIAQAVPLTPDLLERELEGAHVVGERLGHGPPLVATPAAPRLRGPALCSRSSRVARTCRLASCRPHRRGVPLQHRSGDLLR